MVVAVCRACLWRCTLTFTESQRLMAAFHQPIHEPEIDPQPSRDVSVVFQTSVTAESSALSLLFHR